MFSLTRNRRTLSVAGTSVVLGAAIAFSGGAAHADSVAQPHAAKSTSVQKLDSCGSYHAVGYPGKWSQKADGTCSLLGHPGFKIGYTWSVQPGTNQSACVKVKSFTKHGKAKWVSAGCGQHGSATVYWGNMADKKSVKVMSQTAHLAGIEWT